MKIRRGDRPSRPRSTCALLLLDSCRAQGADERQPAHAL